MNAAPSQAGTFSPMTPASFGAEKGAQKAPTIGPGMGSDGQTPKFSEVWEQIQSKNGVEPPKPREIKKTLGKDDFLKIMVTQMQHQDPMTPFKAEEFAAQLAQFTSLEQMQNMNTSLTQITKANQPLERLAMAGLIGKTVTVDRQRFQHKQEQSDVLSFTLPSDAKEVKLVVADLAGEPVYEKDLGALRKGEQTFTWDGKQANTLQAKTGIFQLQVVAKDEKGADIQLDPLKQAKVIGVSFEGDEGVLLIGDARTNEKIMMRNVIKIEDAVAGPAGGAMAPSNPGAPIQTSFPQQPAAAAVPQAASLQQPAPGQIADAIAKFQAQANAAKPAQPAAQPEAPAVSGFPNGLDDRE